MRPAPAGIEKYSILLVLKMKYNRAKLRQENNAL